MWDMRLGYFQHLEETSILLLRMNPTFPENEIEIDRYIENMGEYICMVVFS